MRWESLPNSGTRIQETRLPTSLVTSPNNKWIFAPIGLTHLSYFSVDPESSREEGIRFWASWTHQQARMIRLRTQSTKKFLWRKWEAVDTCPQYLSCSRVTLTVLQSTSLAAQQSPSSQTDSLRKSGLFLRLPPPPQPSSRQEWGGLWSRQGSWPGSFKFPEY